MHVFPSGHLANNDASLAASEAQGQMGTAPLQVCARMKLCHHLLRWKVEEHAAHLHGSLDVTKAEPIWSHLCPVYPTSENEIKSMTDT